MRLAATVMLVRDGAAGLEVMMVRRSSKSPFAPDAYVFPGGAVDPEDYDEGAPGWHAAFVQQFRAGVDEALPSSEPPVSERDAAALVRAAVRELREEVAVDVPIDSLVLFSHWITPPTEPRRYNTHFFIASVADNVHGVADAVETHDAHWVAPAQALARHEREEMHLIYPTVKHLERLASYKDVASVMAFAREKPILTIMPDRAPWEGFVLPEHLEHAW